MWYDLGRPCAATSIAVCVARARAGVRCARLASERLPLLYAFSLAATRRFPLSSCEILLRFKPPRHPPDQPPMLPQPCDVHDEPRRIHLPGDAPQVPVFQSFGLAGIPPVDGHAGAAGVGGIIGPASPAIDGHLHEPGWVSRKGDGEVSGPGRAALAEVVQGLADSRKRGSPCLHGLYRLSSFTFCTHALNAGCAARAKTCPAAPT